MQYGASVSRELPGAINLTVGYTGSKGKDMFLRGVANILDPVTRVRPAPSYGQIDYKTSGCLDGLVINGFPIAGCGSASYDALAAQRHASVPRRLHRRLPVPGTSRNKGTTQGSNEAATSQNTFDYETEYGTNPQDIPHTFNGSVVYQLPGDGFWTRRLARRRHRQRAQRRAAQRDHQPSGQLSSTARPSPTSPAATAAARSVRIWCPASTRI